MPISRVAILSVSLSSLTLGCAGGSAPDAPAAQEQPVAATDAQRPAPAKRFTGTLHGGVVAIGAETTGWVLQSDDLGRVDVDVSKAADAAAKLDGKPVVIEGELVTVSWPERGEKRMLIADSIRPAERDGDADDAPKR